MDRELKYTGAAKLKSGVPRYYPLSDNELTFVPFFIFLKSWPSQTTPLCSPPSPSCPPQTTPLRSAAPHHHRHIVTPHHHRRALPSAAIRLYLKVKQRQYLTIAAAYVVATLLFIATASASRKANNRQSVGRRRIGRKRRPRYGTHEEQERWFWEQRFTGAARWSRDYRIAIGGLRTTSNTPALTMSAAFFTTNSARPLGSPSP
jgi:hypothetical protein